ncbi:type A2 lantipeptide [Streptomyces sp. NPDC048639]|uniref:type A2 lantipeptide n=1 Tax=Streptomyces sp. NPDC048639 TaxID=3365581 RepID=UPI0037201418
MHKDFTPQVETREIADEDLDNVSGGVLGLAVGNVVGTVDSVAPVSEVTGIASQATGLDTTQVTGLAGI